MGIYCIILLAVIILIAIYLFSKTNKPKSAYYSNLEYPNLEVMQDQKDEPKYCQIPSKENPFMNLTLGDLMTNPNRVPACNSHDQEIKNQINDNLDSNDLSSKSYLQKQFYTLPVTTAINEQSDFAKWLYKSGQTCKENPKMCFKYEDIRYKTSL